MTLSSSLNAGVAGLNANSSKLATISDNIANSQTAGYKRVDTQFSSLVVSKPGSRYSAGGVQAASFREIDARGSLINTTNVTDLAIAGRGLIPVTPTASVDDNGQTTSLQFVTTGSFRPDEIGELRTASGLTLMGWPADRDGNIPVFPRDTGGGLEPVRVNNSSVVASPTTEVTLGVNLPADETEAGASGDIIPLTIEYFDNLGGSETLSIDFTPTVPATGSSNEWLVEISDSQTPAASNPIASFTVTFDNSAALGGTIASVTGVSGGTYDGTTGVLTTATGGGPLDLNIGAINADGGLSQLAADFGPTGIAKNGSAVGALVSIEIDENGFLKGIFDGGAIRTLYQIPVADVPNFNGLQAVGSQAYVVTSESGPLFLFDAGDGPTGAVKSFTQEQSTTDIAAELTSLITTQRAYSSNATVIRTVDEMLQETTNLKR